MSASLFDALQKFDKTNLKPTETVVRDLPVIGDTDVSGASTALSGEDIKEFYDEPDVLKEKAMAFVELLKNSKHFVVYTGAGVSTAAKIPDYRGPKGVWTLAARGQHVSMEVTLEQAIPTYTHMALLQLIEHDLLHFIVSTNVDGLHRRSGLKAEQLAELHGNIYREICSECEAEYLRLFDVTKHARQRFTGRLCQKGDCRARLRDSIINFTEMLPEKDLRKSYQESERADLTLVIGSSMRVTPASDLPSYSYNNGGTFVICNLQKTPYDDHTSLRVFAKCDEFMELVMKELNIEVQEFQHNPVGLEDSGIVVDDKFDEISPYIGKSMADEPLPSNVLTEIENLRKDYD